MPPAALCSAMRRVRRAMCRISLTPADRDRDRRHGHGRSVIQSVADKERRRSPDLRFDELDLVLGALTGSDVGVADERREMSHFGRAIARRQQHARHTVSRRQMPDERPAVVPGRIAKAEERRDRLVDDDDAFEALRVSR